MVCDKRVSAPFRHLSSLAFSLTDDCLFMIVVFVLHDCCLLSSLSWLGGEGRREKGRATVFPLLVTLLSCDL